MAKCQYRFNHEWFLIAFIWLSLLCGSTSAQDCACSPGSYKFTFDFSLTCPPVNITRNGGVETTFCQIIDYGGPGDNITDLVPAEVYQVDMIELAQNSTTINQGNVSGSFDEGDSFMFESIVHGSSEAIDAPKILQVNIFATNILGQPIINFFAIRFTNDCGIYPVIDEGNSAGWVYFTELEPPPRTVCPAVPTDSPSSSPTRQISSSPTRQIATSSPTLSLPSILPITPSPSEIRTTLPSQSSETDSPVTRPPTNSPVTFAPVVSEAPFPASLSMSLSMSMSYDMLLGLDVDEFGRDFILTKNEQFENDLIQESKKSSKESSKKSSNRGSVTGSRTSGNEEDGKASKKRDRKRRLQLHRVAD